MHATGDDFIGMRFGVNGHIEVIRRVANGKHKHRAYLIKCTTCAQKPEIYGEGFFEVKKGILLKGQLPCGCGHNHQMNSEQYKTAVQLLAEERGYDVLGYDNDEVTYSTRVNLRCRADGYCWAPRISGFFYGKGCKECARKALALLNTTTPSRFLEYIAKWGDGYEFWKGSNKGQIWYYKCPRCSNDEYVQADLCSGVFKSSLNNFQNKVMACRCVSAFKFTKEQQEHRIKKFLLDDAKGVSFSRWGEEFRGNQTKLVLRCEKHTEWTTTPNGILSMRTGCPDCAAGGYKPHLPGFVYVLKINSPNGTAFTGYGITNKPSTRTKTHIRNLAAKGFYIEDSEVFETGGQDAFNIEKVLKSYFPTVSQDVSGFRRESTDYSLYGSVVAMVNTEIQTLEECI